MNWGHKIFLSFVVFGVFIITLVVVCVRQDFYLVSEDYYQQELDFEDQLVRERNALGLPQPPEIVYSSGKKELEVVFPEDISKSVLEGEVIFFRPSNAKQDFKSPLKLNTDGKQVVDLSKRQQGIWYVELSWRDSQKEYSMEKRIYL